MTTTVAPPTVHEAGPERPSPWRYVILAVVIGLAAFWIWALFFASKESINGIGEDDWSDRAQAICEAADAEREDLADFRRVDAGDQAMLAERAGIVDQATGHPRTDARRRRRRPTDRAPRVPSWSPCGRPTTAPTSTTAGAFSDGLRAGRADAFAETVVDGIPISAKIARFARDNFMPACAPPSDLG